MKRRVSIGVPIKKFLLTLMVILLLVTALTGAVSAEDGFTYVYPISDGETFTVPAGDSITLQWFWLATTKGLVGAFLRSFSASYTIYDDSGEVVRSKSPAQADAIWGPIQQINPADWDVKCAMPDHWLTPGEVGGIKLEPGPTRWSTSGRSRAPSPTAGTCASTRQPASR